MTLSAHLLNSYFSDMDPNSVPIQTPQKPGMNGNGNGNGNGMNGNGTTPNGYRYQPFQADVLSGRDGSQFGAHHGMPSTPWGGGYMPPTPMPGRFTPWSEDRVATMQARLAKRLGPEYVATRPGPGGGPKLSYIEAWKVINLANEVFGFNGWSSSITSLKTDFLETNAQDRCCIGITAIVRVTLQDGCFHEDLGYGHAENVRGKAAALEKAQKEAVTDGVKRALKHFGNVLGNCLYDKEFCREVGKIRVPPAKFNVDELERRPEFTPQGATRPAPQNAASAIPQHVSGHPKPPAPPPPQFHAPPERERAETPLRCLDECNDINMDDSEFGYLEEESFLDDLDESVLASKAGNNVPMLSDKNGAGQATAVNNAPAYQHRHRPDIPQDPQPEPQAQAFVRNNSSSSDSSTGTNGPDSKAPKRTVGGFAIPNGSSSTTTAVTASSAASRRAAMMAAISAGSAVNAENTPARPQSPRIPSGGVEAVAARAQSNLRAHGTNLEIETDENNEISVKYGQFTSARGVKRGGTPSPTKWDGRTRLSDGRSALAEIPAQSEASSDWKRSRISM